MKLTSKIVAAIAVACLANFSVANAQIIWTGTTSSDASVGSNYTSNTAPTYGTGTISSSLVIQDNATATGNAMVYSAAQGTSVFSGSLNVGENDASPQTGDNSEFDVTGGNVTFSASSFPNSIGFHSNGTSTIGVSGGVLNFVGGFNTGYGPDSLWLGNETSGTFNLSGGAVNLQDQLGFSRNGGTASLNISGGVFDVQGTGGTVYNGNGNQGLARINLSGNGVFEETDSNAINFGLSMGNNFALNYMSGSTAEFSLLDETQTGFDSLITGGDIEINGVVDTSTADFAYTTAVGPNGTQGILQLAGSPESVPEPSTYAMVFGGLLMLLGYTRWSRNRTQ